MANGGRAIIEAQALLLRTHFRSMLKRVLNFELSSDFSDTYASGLEVVVLSAADAMEVAGDGAGVAVALFEGGSPETGELMLAGWGNCPLLWVEWRGALLFNIAGWRLWAAV